VNKFIFLKTIIVKFDNENIKFQKIQLTENKQKKYYLCNELFSVIILKILVIITTMPQALNLCCFA